MNEKEVKNRMKCVDCNTIMPFVKGLRFNKYTLDGWQCQKCGEEYYVPEQANRILWLNKLKKSKIKAKLGRIKSNLILRIPKDVEKALDLKEGEEVIVKIDDKGLKIIPA